MRKRVVVYSRDEIMKFKYWKFVAYLNCTGFIMTALPLHNPVLANTSDLRATTSNSSAKLHPEGLVDGLEFRTLTPDKPVEIPRKGDFSAIRFGLRITNKSSSDRKFRSHLIIPNMIDKEHKSVLPSPDECHIYGAVAVPSDGDERYTTVKPGESVDLFKDGIMGYEKGTLIIRYALTTGHKMVCDSKEIKPGRYSVFIIYEGESESEIIGVYPNNKTKQRQIWAQTVGAIPSFIDFVETSKAQ
jgi:hypothetical protein